MCIRDRAVAEVHLSKRRAPISRMRACLKIKTVAPPNPRAAAGAHSPGRRRPARQAPQRAANRPLVLRRGR
eukprot:2773812-Alexandrium_andersonii.AAC.1